MLGTQVIGHVPSHRKPLFAEWTSKFSIGFFRHVNFFVVIARDVEGGERAMALEALDGAVFEIHFQIHIYFVLNCKITYSWGQSFFA